MKNRRTFSVLLILAAVAVVSCTPFLPAERQSPEGDLPPTFSIYGSEPQPLQRWWETFDDPELNALVETAFSGSFTIRKAWARLKQARARAVGVGADLYPDLTVTGNSVLERQRIDNGAGADIRSGDTYAVGLASSYEIDLWGRIRSETEAARLEAIASREDLNTAAITLAAEVAARWSNIVSARMQIQLLKEQLETNRVFLELVDLRFRKGMVSALDVYQQKQVVEKVAAQIPIVERNEQLLLHELALLLGKPVGARLEIGRKRLPPTGKIPDTGIPSDLLANRPDIRSAGLRLRAADWQVAAARANRLPAVNLNARAGFGPQDLDLIFDNWILQLAASLVGPILDGERRDSEVDRTRAVVDENLANYREIVYRAIREVEDALVIEQKQRQHIEMLQQQIKTARNALVQAGERYRKGLNTYLPVLTQLVSVQGLELDLIQQEALLVVNRIDLYRSLGGMWPYGLTPAES